MTDVVLFRLHLGTVVKLPGTSVAIEKSLQSLIEQHLESFLGIRFLASEYATTKSHGGRIDTLGLDEDASPVIIEYKRSLNENVISQGLFYLDWLLDHRGDFKLLVLDRLGSEAAASVSWQFPRLVCIAGEFTKYDQYAVQQIPRNIELIRYRKYGDDLILLEQVARNAISASSAAALGIAPIPASAQDPGTVTPPVISSDEFISRYDSDFQDWFHGLRAFIHGLGGDVEERVVESSSYIAFRRLTTFAYLNFLPTKKAIGIDLPLESHAVTLEPGFSERKPQKFVRVWVTSVESAERAQPLIATSYALH